MVHHIEEMAFAGIPNLCHLALIRTALVNMPPLTPVKRHLEALYIVSNNIDFVPHGYFIGFGKLRLLNMRNNALRVIPNITPLRNTITGIFLGENKIYYISPGLTGTPFSLLKSIHMEGNIIQAFDSNMLRFWPMLQTLDLSRNRIADLPTSYPTEIYKNCTKNHKITLIFADNPIYCSQAIESLISRRINNTNSADLNCYITIRELMYTKCASPAYLCGRDLATLGKFAEAIF